MSKGSVAVAGVAAHATHLNKECSRCERRGRFLLARLIALYGEDFPMTDLGAEIAACFGRFAPIRAEAGPRRMSAPSSGNLS
jgi:hypothetical protein